MNQDFKKIYRSRSDRMIGGLCAGLGHYTNIDPTIVRLVFALSAIYLFPMPIILYFIMALIVPEEPLTATPTVEVVDPQI